MVLSIDLNLKLKKLFSEKNFSKLEEEIEQLGNLENLTSNLQLLYATSKALNIKSKKKDFKLASYLYEKLYRADQSNMELFYNLIFTSVKAKYFKYLETHIINQYQRKSDDPKILEGMGKMYSFYSDMDQANNYYKQLLDIKPIYQSVWFSFLAGLNYSSNFDQNKYLNYCKKFDETQIIAIEEFKKTKNNKIKKVGFLSSDLKTHSVSFFLEDLLRNIKSDKFELHAISNLDATNYDEVTNSLKTSFDHWHETSDFNDIKFAQYVRSLNLDILIDLCGYTFNNRVNALRARLANKQVSWCGYCNTLGIKNMDFLIADPNLIKENEKHLYTEEVLFMPNIWNVMNKPKKLPSIETNDKQKKTFTYGSFNNFKKISNETIHTWSKILKDGNCKLILKNSDTLEDDRSNQIILEKFKKNNVNLENIIIIPTQKNIDEHLKIYNKIDLAIDTFPYPGVTTTFQAVLMGVPVLTMKGFNFNSRCGESININLGLEDYIANDTDDYINKAIDFKNDFNKVINLKKNLRKKALNSNLFNVKEFGKKFSEILTNLS